MADWLHPEVFDVPTQGGELRVAQWGDDGPMVLALHGITASHMEWPYLARELAGEVRFIAPDLRGRGGSRDLPGPYGLRVHADDAVRVLDHVGAEDVVVVGHSMGGFVGAILAMHYPERVRHLILIDGGVPLAVPPPDADIEQILHALLGPSIERCNMTFESVDACLDFWRVHPSMQDEGAWNEVFEAYVAYDLMGEPPELRSKVNIDAVVGDGRDSLTSEDVRIAVEKVSCPITFVRAPRGILNQTPGLYPDEFARELAQRTPNLTDVLIEDVNHYTIVTSERGAGEIAGHVRAALSTQPA